jgi:hypothetical protein
MQLNLQRCVEAVDPIEDRRHATQRAAATHVLTAVTGRRIWLEDAKWKVPQFPCLTRASRSNTYLRSRR